MTVEVGQRASAIARTGFAQHVHYLRGFAALSVLLFHLSEHLRLRQMHGVTSELFGSSFGLYGVAVFFAISGFLMARAVTSADPATFLAHRIARIYPLFFVVVVLSAIIFAYFANGLPVSFLVLSLAPVGRIPYPLGVEWTLVFEMSFYVLLFGIMKAGFTRYIELFAGTWIIIILFGLATGLGKTSGAVVLADFPLAYANIAFACGLLIPTLLARGLNPWMMLPLALASFWTPGSSYAVAMITAGIASAIMVACAVDLSDRAPAAHPFLHEPLSRLGDYSYALYLCHVPVLRLVYWFGKDDLTPDQLWMIALAASMFIASILGRVDIFVYKMSKTMIKKTPRLFLGWGTAAFAITFIGVAIVRS